MALTIPLDDVVHHLISPTSTTDFQIYRNTLFFILIFNVFFLDIFFQPILPFFRIRAANQQVMQYNANSNSIDDSFETNCTANYISNSSKAGKTIFEQANTMLNLDSRFC